MDANSEGAVSFGSIKIKRNNILGVNSNEDIVIDPSGTGGVVVVGTIKTQVYITSTIPLASAAGVGARAFVTDANATTFGTAYVGGSTNKVPVWSDGSAWYIG